MKDPAKMFIYMADCLKEWNFPQIHAMDHTQVAEIFSASNRPFLVTWLLKRLYPEQFQTDKDYDPAVLASFIYDVGFCTKAQKEKIFCTNFYEEQVTILYKIFQFLKILSEPVHNNCFDRVTVADTEELNNLDLNLFPCYGPTTVLPTEDRKDLVERLEQELEILNYKILYKDTGDTTSLGTSSNYKEECDLVLKELDVALPGFKSTAYELINNPNILVDEDTVIDNNMSSIIKTAAGNLREISRYFKDLKTISEFAVKNNVILKNSLEDAIGTDLMKNAVHLSNDVLNIASQFNTKLKIDQ